MACQKLNTTIFFLFEIQELYKRRFNKTSFLVFWSKMLYYYWLWKSSNGIWRMAVAKTLPRRKSVSWLNKKCLWCNKHVLYWKIQCESILFCKGVLIYDSLCAKNSIKVDSRDLPHWYNARPIPKSCLLQSRLEGISDWTDWESEGIGDFTPLTERRDDPLLYSLQSLFHFGVFKWVGLQRGERGGRVIWHKMVKYWPRQL